MKVYYATCADTGRTLLVKEGTLILFIDNEDLHTVFPKSTIIEVVLDISAPTDVKLRKEFPLVVVCFSLGKDTFNCLMLETYLRLERHNQKSGPN